MDDGIEHLQDGVMNGNIADNSTNDTEGALRVGYQANKSGGRAAMEAHRDDIAWG